MAHTSKAGKKPSTQSSYLLSIDRSIIPAFGCLKRATLTRLDVNALVMRHKKSPTLRKIKLPV